MSVPSVGLGQGDNTAWEVLLLLRWGDQGDVVVGHGDHPREAGGISFQTLFLSHMKLTTSLWSHYRG